MKYVKLAFSENFPPLFLFVKLADVCISFYILISVIMESMQKFFAVICIYICILLKCSYERTDIDIFLYWNSDNFLGHFLSLLYIETCSYTSIYWILIHCYAINSAIFLLFIAGTVQLFCHSEVIAFLAVATLQLYEQY